MSKTKPMMYPTDNDPYMMSGCKLMWHMDRVRAWEKGERIAPLLIDIGATKVCNLSCQWCYGVYQKMDNHSVIPEDILIRLFSEAPLLGVKAITLTGDGEPTLNKGMWKAIEEGKRHGLDIGIATNCVAVDSEDKVNALVDNCVWIRVTIGGASPEGYKKIHGFDYFKKVVENTKDIMRAKRQRMSDVTVGYQMVLIPDCLDEVIPLAQLAIDLGLDYFVIKQFSNPENSGIPASGYDQDKFVEKSMPVLKKAEEMSTEKTKIIPKYDLIQNKNKRMYPYCIDLPFIFQISGSGKCYPCGYLFNKEEFCYGDLHEQTLGEIIHSDKYWGIIDKIKGMSTKDLCNLGSCRHDISNLFLHNYLNKPLHSNHI